VISELWVDYLTQMEALRVSIGLEAYAQRDPLVQYKNRAFELFQTLLMNMRSGVVTRMFVYRPRDLNAVQAASGRNESSRVEPEPGETAQLEDGDDLVAVSEEKSAASQPGQAPESAQAGRGDSGRNGKKRRRRR